MSAEDRLRTALHAAADDTPVDPASLDRIERRTVAARRRRRGVGGGLAAVALVAVAVTVPLALRDDGGEPVQTGPASDTQDTTTTTSSTTTTEPGAEGSPSVIPNPSFVWPALDGDRQFTSPEEAAVAFGIDYLGMAQRPAVELLSARTEGAATVALRPRTEGGGVPSADGPVTVVDLSEFPSGRPRAPHWFVLHVTSPHLTVTTPALGASVTSPLHVEGVASNLFEGNVIVELRSETGAVITQTNTTAAGSGPEQAPFSVEVPFEIVPTDRGAIVVKSDSGIEGTPEATVVPVTFPAAAPETVVQVFLVDGQGDFVAAPRRVPRTTGVLRAALEELLSGTTPAEEARELTSPFDHQADLLRGVTITEDATAVVDLDPGIVDALAGADGAVVLASLDHTVFQYPSVTWVRYTVGGGCGDFAGIGTDLLCERRSRDQY